MSKRLSFSIAVNLLTENFKKGARTVKDSFRSMQMQVITFAAALGAGGLGLMGLVSRFRSVARETSQVLTALKNVSAGTRGFADNLRFINDMAKKYGLEVNALTGNFAKFTASATQANMSMDDQKKVFESLSRASTAFGLSAEDTNGVFLALSQMMSKGKISSEELRKQMGERIPIAMQAMAKAAGVSAAGLEKLLKQGKLMSADIIPKFAEALNNMIPNVDTDNLETSLNRLKNTFGEIVNASGFQGKYKALIDGLNSLLQSAAQNVQKIIVLAIAAISFVIGKGLTNIYQKYAAVGNKVVADATAASAQLRKLTLSRVSAEKKLKDLEAQRAVATGVQEVRLKQSIETQKQILTARTAAVNKARIDAQVAREQAAAIQTAGIWAKAGAAIKGTFLKIGAAAKVMIANFGFAAILAGVTAIIVKLIDWFKHLKKVKNTISDLKKEAAGIEGSSEVKILQTQLAIMNDKTKSQKEIITAQNELRRLLGLEKGDQRDLNKLVADRVQLLKASAQADFYAQKNVEAEDKINQYAKEGGIDKGQAIYIDALVNRSGMTAKKAATIMTQLAENMFGGDMEKADRAFAAISKMRGKNDDSQDYLAIYKHSDEQLKGAIRVANQLTTNVPTQDDPDKDALRKAENRLEALRKLDEADRARQIEKQRFDLDLRQKDIDLLDDSFEKRTRQTALNLEKEKLAIEEHQSDLLKKQMEFAKNQYVSVHGDDKGFEAYFAKLQKAGFKDSNGVSIFPEGLRPEDIADQINQMLTSIHSAFDKANGTIVRESAETLERERLVFEGELTQTITSIKNHYKELKKQYAGNSKEYIELQNLENKELELARLAHERKVIESLEEVGERQLAIAQKSYLLQSRKELALLRLRQKNNASLMSNLQSEFKTITGKDYDDLSDTELDNLINEYPELISLIQTAIVEQAELNKELENIPTKTFNELFNILSNAISELSSLEGEVGSFFSSVGSQLGNLKVAFDKDASSADKYSAAISGVVNIISMIASASQKRKQAEREYYQNAIAFAHEYTLALNEQLRLNNSLSQSGFVKDYTGQLNDAYSAMSDAVNNYYDSVQKLGDGKVKVDLVNAIDWGNVGKGAAAGAATGAVIGSVVPVIGTAIGAAVGAVVGALAGLFGGKKKKNEYAALLDIFPGLIDSAGNLNKELAETLVNTEQTDGATKQLLQNALDWADAVEEANQQVKDIVLELAGDLGNDLKTAIVDAWKAGKDAAVDMFDAAGASLEKFIENLLYSVVFGDLFKQFEDDLIASLNPATGDGDIVDDYLRLMEGMDKLDDVYIALLDAIKNRPETAKFGLWNDDEAKTQDSTKGYSTTMDQDTGGAILGRVTGIHESILEMKSFASAASIDTAIISTQTTGIFNELKKQTEIAYETQQIASKSYRKLEGIDEKMEVFEGIQSTLDEINRNTKGLAPR